MRWAWCAVVLWVGCTPVPNHPDAAGTDSSVLDATVNDAAVSDAPAVDVPLPDAGAPPDAPLTGCAAGCAVFNDGASECGVSNYDCDALCAESTRIGEDTGCSAQTSAFWACFAAAPRGAFCVGSGVCGTELDALDACVSAAPSTDCLRACAMCGDLSYGNCAVGCARRDAHAHLLGCDASYQAYYTCRLGGGCPDCVEETNAFTACWSSGCSASPEHCPVTP